MFSYPMSSCAMIIYIGFKYFIFSNDTCNIFTALTKLNKLVRIAIHDSDVEELPAHSIRIHNDNPYDGLFDMHTFDRSRGSLKTIRNNAFSDSHGKI